MVGEGGVKVDVCKPLTIYIYHIISSEQDSYFAGAQCLIEHSKRMIGP